MFFDPLPPVEIKTIPSPKILTCPLKSIMPGLKKLKFYAKSRLKIFDVTNDIKFKSDTSCVPLALRQYLSE